MELHLRCLYTHDAQGRVSRQREPGGPRCPRFHLGRTRLGNLWRFRDDLPSDAIRQLARYAAKERPLDSEHTPPERIEPIRRVLRETCEIAREWSGPAYRFPDVIPEALDVSRVVAVRPGNAAVLARWFEGEIAQLALRQPCFAWVEEGHAVSLCHSARPRSVSGESDCLASEAGVETAISHRGLGHAPAVVFAWAGAVRSQGGLPLYSTSWSNRASLSVARNLDLILYGEDFHFT